MQLKIKYVDRSVRMAQCCVGGFFIYKCFKKFLQNCGNWWQNGELCFCVVDRKDYLSV